MVQGNCNAVSLLAVAKVAFENSRFSSLLANGGRFGRRKVY